MRTSTTSTTRVRSRRLAGVVVLLVAVGVLPSAARSETGTDHAASQVSSETGLWIVQLTEPSLATYPGGVTGLAPTSPQVTGADQLDVNTRPSRSYRRHLQNRQAEFTARMEQVLGRAVTIEFRYQNVLNALAVDIDAAEAARLARLPHVATVYPDQIRELTTDVSHDLIGSAAIWDGDTGSGAGTRGEDVLVGMLDTGINPDHPSFAATDGEGYTHTNPFGPGSFVGVCDPSHVPHEPICNDKLVGAWNFHPGSFTARDNNDHGSHTGSTMAGNIHQATFMIGDTEFTRTVQGVAPRANLISYKVCEPSCPQTSMLAAVNQAIADGVDVLNFSISGTDNPWLDPVDVAFLEAFNAGVFVAASAGNDGPGAGTVAKTAPWNASVAASTHHRVFAQTVDVTAPEPVPPELTGLSAVPGDDRAVTAPVEAELRDAGLVQEGNQRGCEPFPAGAFTGVIALIQRGDCAFSDKITNARAAGAIAVIVANQVAGPPITMGGLATTTIPSVMVDQDSGEALRELIAEPAPVQVRINVETELIIDPDWADVLAGFSSRGPSQFELLAPTFTAPGVNILAAARGAGSDTDRYAVLQGTSMAAPHAAGAGALLAALHPDWSPAQIRSALAGTADPTRLAAEDGQRAPTVFDQGAGLLDLDAAGRVGLVLDETYDNFRAADPGAGGEPTALNVPGLVDHDCAASCSWTRTVTSTADLAATYAAAGEAPAGVEITAEPATFTISPGQSQELTITATVTGQPAGEWVHAAVRLDTDAVHGNGRPVAGARYPVAVIPAPAGLTLDPSEITGTQAPGEQVEHTLTIGNSGGEDLTWSVTEGESQRQSRIRQSGPSTPVPTAEPPVPAAEAPAGEFAPSRNPQAPAGAVTRPEPAEPDQLPGGTVRLTHSESQEVMAGNSIACALPPTGTTVDNGYLRTFSLESFGIFSEFEVTEVSFGVEAVNHSPVTLTVNLYTLDAEPFVYANLTELGSAEVTLNPQGAGIAEVPVSGVAPEGSTLVVEVESPDTGFVSGFFIGSNRAGQTGPSYIRAERCDGIGPEPVDLAAIGAPNMHIVMDVTGVAEAPACELPGWASVSPTSGTVAPGQQQPVTVGFDSTGLAAGETHEATLCLESNDPNRPFALVPLTLQVEADTEPPPEASQEIIASVPEDPGEGSLIISVDPDDRTVILPPVGLAPSGDRLATNGELRPVTVTDTRAAANPGWDTTAQAGEFTADAATFRSGYLGWLPFVASQSGDQQVRSGEPVPPGFPTGDGLSRPQTLATTPAGGGVGVAVLGAGLALEVPLETEPGTYAAVLTLTAI